MRFVFFSAALLYSLFSFGGNPQPFSDNYRVKTVVIDAGHGGKDPGAIGASKSYEKDITLAVSLKLGELIKKYFPQIKVVYTRDKDVFVELHDRAAIANKHNADLFISIHCNSSPDKNATGAEVYCLGLHRTEANLEVAKRENSVILMEDNYVEKYDGFDPNAAEAHIIFSLFQYAFLNQSISLASKIDHHFPVTAARRSRGVKQAGFLVLYRTTMPGVLVELGFISNKEEDLYLKSPAGQEKISLALFKAFENYVREGSTESAPKPDAPEIKEQPKVAEPKPDTPKEVKPAAATFEKTPPANTAVKTAEPKPANTTTESTKPETKEPVKAESPEKIPSDNPEFIFKVQFFATKIKLPENDERLKQVLDWEIEKTETGILRYLSGKFISLKTAEEQMKVLHQIGYSDAFIAPYMNGTKRISLKEYLDKYQK
jgi:N-acetylmuramoyl-L-alanine amidase